MNLIFLTIEVKSRELISKLFFILSNINQKFFFIIGDKKAIERATNYFGKGIYFYKSINDNDTKHIQRIKKKGNLYVSLDEEGGYALSNDDIYLSFLKYRSNSKNVELVDRVYTWGSFDHRIWSKKYSNFKKKFKKTGAPRLDLWRSDVYKNYFDKDIKKINRKHGSFIFIPSSFYSSDRDLRKAISNSKKLKKSQTTLSLKRRIDAQKYNYSIFKNFLQMVKKLSLDFPKENIIIKPHPSEDISNWKSQINFVKYKNIIVEDEFDITAYIAASKCVIFNSSIAGAQAVIMGKRAISYGDVKKDKSLRNFSNFCTKQAKNYKVLKNELKKINNRDNYRNKNQNIKYIKQRLHLTSKSSSKLIIEDIKELILKNNIKNNLNLEKVKFLSVFFLFWDYFLLFLSKIKNLFFKRNFSNIGDYIRKMGSGINKNEILIFFEKMKLKNSVKIIKFSRSGYIIFKK